MTNAEKLNLPAFIGWLYDLPPIAAFVAACSITPGAMFVIASVLESRVLPVWRGQFRSFIPGDILLGGCFGANVALITRLPDTQDQWYQSGLWHWLVFICCVVGGALAHFVLDAPNYDRYRLYSPTKIYHDLVLYVGYAFLLIVAGIPALIEAEGGVIFRIILLSCFGSWLLCLVYDNVLRNPRQLAMTAHVVDWMPFWTVE